MFCHDTLESLYRIDFILMHVHKYSLTELNNMLPWEREVIITQLVQYIEQEKQERERAKQQAKR